MDENKMELTGEKEEKVSGGTGTEPSAEITYAKCAFCGGTLLINKNPFTGKVLVKCQSCGYTNA